MNKIKETIDEKIEEQGMKELYYEIELPLVEVLAHMEFRGFKVDLAVLEELGSEFQKEIDILTKDIYTLSGEEFNINSPKQLGEVLFDKLKLPVIKKTKTGYSTDAEVLDKLKGQHDIVDKILKYRQMVKLKSTYIDGLIAEINPETGKIHSTFNQTITNTGRISSTEPNLQNIPIRTEEGEENPQSLYTRNRGIYISRWGGLFSNRIESIGSYFSGSKDDGRLFPRCRYSHSNCFRSI